MNRLSFPPETLRQYALLADGERGAVIGPRGDVAFLCVPSWHDAAAFSSLIGGSGHYAVTPADDRFVWGGQYEDGSMVWRSRWVTTSTIIECREALAFPADPDRVVLLRRVQPVEGDTEVEVALDLRAGFGTSPMTECTRTGDVWEGRSGDLGFRWSGAPSDVQLSDGVLRGRLRVASGSHHDLVLEIRRGPVRGSVAAGGAGLADHRAALGGGGAAGGPLPGSRRRAPLAGRDPGTDQRQPRHGGRRDDVLARARRPATQLRLPLRVDPRPVLRRPGRGGGGRVRSCWTPPSTSCRRGCSSTGRSTAPAYTVHGGRVPDESTLDLPGYPGGSDKVGNWVNDQFQLDAFGEALLLLATAADEDRLSDDHWKAAVTAVEAIERRGDEPDAGIWEVRPRRWAHSRLICVAGLTAMARHAPDAQADRWSALAAGLLASAEGDCRHPDGRWQRAPDDPRVDTALLLPALRGAVPYDAPVSVATWRAVRDDLSQDHYVYRFRHDGRPLQDAEGAFLLSGFHLAMATAQQGDLLTAARVFERNRGALGPPGLFTEEFDVGQRQLRGNLPQAFVHAGFVEASCRLADAPDRPSSGH